MKFKTFSRITFFIALFSITILFSCSKKEDDTPAPVTPQGNTALVTAVGSPIGTPSTASIGASGGTIQSTDGRLTVIIPAGALSSNVQISVQPISNQAPLSFGNAYRLQPEGTTFAIPATLVFHYTDSMVALIPEDFL